MGKVVASAENVTLTLIMLATVAEYSLFASALIS
jgi:hypothetical protein